MGKKATVSAKIPEELRNKMRQLGISPSEVIREAIKEEVAREEFERLSERVEEAKPLLQKLSREEAVRSIREDRESR